MGSQESELQRSLKQRHMTMISLGGVIGAGLFVGSGAVMNEAGPAAVLSYFGAGILIVLVMRMLGEMAVANPAVGSFVEYCRSALGPWAGFSVGRLYWYFWAIVLALGHLRRHLAGQGLPVPGQPSGAVALFRYLLIALAELRMRRRLEAEAPERLKLRMWAYHG